MSDEIAKFAEKLDIPSVDSPLGIIQTFWKKHCAKKGKKWSEDEIAETLILLKSIEWHKQNDECIRQIIIISKLKIQGHAENGGHPFIFFKDTMLLRDTFQYQNKVATFRADTQSPMFIYDEKQGIYTAFGRSYVKQFVERIVQDRYTADLSRSVIEAIEPVTYVDASEFLKEAEPRYIPCANGIYDLESETLIPYSKNLRFFNKLHVVFKVNAKCDRFLRFLDEIVKPEDVPLIQEIFGFCLYRDYRFEKAFMFFGGGRNGKSKLLQILRTILGTSNTVEISIKRLEEDRWAMQEMISKYVNISSENSSKSIESSENFKKITGHDQVSAPVKYGADIKALIYAKQIFNFNKLPMVSDLTEAFFQRWIRIDFIHTFKPNTDLEKIENWYQKGFRQANPTRVNEIVENEDEISGILNWSLEGLRRLLKNNAFSSSQTTDAFMMAWQQRANSAYAFLVSAYTLDKTGYVIKEDFKQEYMEYCQTHGLDISTDWAIKKAVADFGASDTKRRINGTAEHIWIGISKKTSIPLQNTLNNKQGVPPVPTVPPLLTSNMCITPPRTTHYKVEKYGTPGIPGTANNSSLTSFEQIHHKCVECGATPCATLHPKPLCYTCAPIPANDLESFDKEVI